MRRLLLILFLLTSGLALQAQGLSNSDEQAIRDILERQRQCWNEGDIECFMIGYWESDELRFMGKKGVTKGFKATKERYYKSYPWQVGTCQNGRRPGRSLLTYLGKAKR